MPITAALQSFSQVKLAAPTRAATQHKLTKPYHGLTKARINTFTYVSSGYARCVTPYRKASIMLTPFSPPDCGNNKSVCSSLALLSHSFRFK